MKTMRSPVNVREAKSHLSWLLEAASQGEEFVVVSNGKPKARIGPLHSPSRPLRVDLEWLRKMPVSDPKFEAGRLIREERDSGN